MLDGGWLYLHVAKSEPSTMGGRVIRIGGCQREGTAREQGVELTFRSLRQGRLVGWRGASHAMAWSGGVVEAELQHEML